MAFAWDIGTEQQSGRCPKKPERVSGYGIAFGGPFFIGPTFQGAL